MKKLVDPKDVPRSLVRLAQASEAGGPARARGTRQLAAAGGVGGRPRIEGPANAIRHSDRTCHVFVYVHQEPGLPPSKTMGFGCFWDAFEMLSCVLPSRPPFFVLCINIFQHNPRISDWCLVSGNERS